MLLLQTTCLCCYWLPQAWSYSQVIWQSKGKYLLNFLFVFRDIKPENVLINLITNKVTLIDFGSGDFIQENFYTNYDGKWHKHRKKLLGSL